MHLRYSGSRSVAAILCEHRCINDLHMDYLEWVQAISI